jgi:hypothetical protein
VSLTAQLVGTNHEVKWQLSSMNVVLTPNDAIFIDSISTSQVVSLDPRFVALPTPTGVELSATTSFTPVSGSTIATVSSAGGNARYFVADSGADSFWANLFALHPATPLHALAVVDQAEMQDLPGFPGATGTLSFGGVAVPLIPHPSLYGVLLLVVVGAYALFHRKVGAG